MGEQSGLDAWNLLHGMTKEEAAYVSMKQQYEDMQIKLTNAVSRIRVLEANIKAVPRIFRELQELRETKASRDTLLELIKEVTGEVHDRQKGDMELRSKMDKLVKYLEEWGYYGE